MEREGIDVKQIRLIHGGKQLCVWSLRTRSRARSSSIATPPTTFPPSRSLTRSDTNSLESYGIKAGEILHMVLALRGGRAL